MVGKHVDWRVISAFPDYELNLLGDVRLSATHEEVHQFRHHNEWAYTLNRVNAGIGERWVVTKNGLIEVTFPDRKRWGKPTKSES